MLRALRMLLGPAAFASTIAGCQDASSQDPSSADDTTTSAEAGDGRPESESTDDDTSSAGSTTTVDDGSASDATDDDAGPGSNDSSETGEAPEDACAVVELRSGADHVCVRRAGGDIWCWGDNSQGQLGAGDYRSSLFARRTRIFDVEVQQLALGWGHGCAVTDRSTVWCWGDNHAGQMCEPGLSGYYVDPFEIDAVGASIVEVAAGARHGCARRSDGHIVCWGYMQHGQLGQGSDGCCYQPVPIEAASIDDAIDLELGGDLSCAIRANGSLWCWGHRSYGELGDEPSGAGPLEIPTLDSGVVRASVGGAHVCALRDDGTLWCWGRNHYGQVGIENGNDCAGSACVRVPERVEALRGSVTSVSAGGAHTCAIVDGSVWCWGHNEFGQLGASNELLSPDPVAVLGLPQQAIEIATGNTHSCALLEDASVWCWGSNDEGQLGNGQLEGGATPVPIWLPCSG